MKCPVCLEEDDSVKKRPELDDESMCDLCCSEELEKKEIYREELRESMK